MITQLFIGICIGSIIASIAWFFILRANKTKLENDRKTREELMHSFGEIWAEIDSLLSSFRSGMMEERSFRDAFAVKIEAINHLLKPNLHLFDVYYVKYIETLIKDYNRKAHLKDANDIVCASEFSSDMETNYTPVAPPEQTDLFKSQIEEVASPASEITAAADQEEEVDFSQTITPVSPEKDSSETQTPFEVTLAPEVHNHNKDEHPAVPQITPESVSDEVDAMFEDAFASFDTPAATIFDPTASPKPEQKIPDDSPLPTASATAAHINVFGEEEVSDETIIGFDKTDFHKHLGTAEIPPFEKRDKHTTDEFSTETLIDIDLHTIRQYMQPAAVTPETVDNDPERTRHFEQLPDTQSRLVTDKTELDISIADNAMHTDTEYSSKTPRTEYAPPIPEETTYTRSDTITNRTVPILDDDAFEVIIPEKNEAPATILTDTAKTVEPIGQTIPSNDDDVITGDDIMDKIASMETAASTKKTEPAASQESVVKSVPAGGVKGPLVGDLKPTQKQPVTNELKSSETSAPISGDDVADQIDSFFGLFK